MSRSAPSIVYVWDADYPWDVRTEKLSCALTRAGHRVAIAARNRTWLPTVEERTEATIHRMPPWRWVGRPIDAHLGFPAFFNPRWYSLITRTVDKTNADLIIVRDLPLCPTAIAVGRRRGIPVMLDMAENYPAMIRALWETGRHTPVDYLVRNPRATELVEKYSVQRVDHILVVVEESQDRLRSLGVPLDKLSIVSNTPPLARVADVPERRGSTGDTIDVAYMGNLEVARGLVESIDAVAQLSAAGHRTRLRVIGKGRDEAIMRRRAQTLGLGPDQVEFLGFIESHSDALEIVAAANVGLLPHQKCDSWDTTIPNKLFDYMAAGLPVVSSDAAPCARILRETGCGEVYASGDAAGLATAILRAAEPDAAKCFGDAGRRAVLARYNWEYDTRILVDAVDRTLKGPEAARTVRDPQSLPLFGSIVPE